MRKFTLALLLFLCFALCAKAEPLAADSVPLTAVIAPGEGTALYAQPIPTAETIGQLPQGTQVFVNAPGIYWCTVTAGGQTGYVPAAALFYDDWGTLDQEGGSTSDKPRLAVFNVGMSPSGNWTLTLREKPDRKAAKITTYVGGTVMVVLEKGKEYTRVHAGDKVGYLLTKYLTFYPQAESAQQYAVVSNEDKVSLRYDRRFGDTGISAYLEPGAVVTLIWEKKGWACVEADGLQGYVVAEFLKAAD